MILKISKATISFLTHLEVGMKKSNEYPPKILGEFDLDGEKYPILASQPIPHRWTWDTPPHLAELMSFTLIDLGQGPSPFLFLITTFSISANNIQLSGLENNQP
jgi:hypothetical protein